MKIESQFQHKISAIRGEDQRIYSAGNESMAELHSIDVYKMRDNTYITSMTDYT